MPAARPPGGAVTPAPAQPEAAPRPRRPHPGTPPSTSAPNASSVTSDLSLIHILPALDPRPVKAVLCADGYTVDETGLLGFVPGMDGVVVAVGFSGHGFKMASSLGAAAADLISEGTTTTDVSFMDPARFLPPQHNVADIPLNGAASGPELS